MIGKKNLIVLLLAAFFLVALLFTLVPTWSAPDVGEYDPWCDYNDDGYTGIDDIFATAQHFGTEGNPITKAFVAYDSGWVDVSGETGQYFTFAHNLNSTDVMVDIAGKTTPDGGAHQRYYGGTEHMPGWTRTYGGIGHEGTQSVVQASDGGYALAGYTNFPSAGGHDFWLVKADANRVIEWNRTYGGANDEYAYSVVQTDDGGYAVAGTTSSFGAEQEFWLVKLDSTGNMQWNKTYGRETSYEGAFSVVQTSDGGYALAGYTYTDPNGADRDLYVVKTDANGNMLWNKTYGGASVEWATSLVQTDDSGYAIGGYTLSFGAGNYDFWLVKVNSSGTMQWNRTYGGSNMDVAFSVVQTNDGGYAIAGDTYSFAIGDTDSWLVKTDSNGNIQWMEDYFKYGLAWTNSTKDTFTLYRGTIDPYWNYVRVRIWKAKETP